MNDTDLDIILAIADGQLTGQAKQDALERIAAEPELGEELAAQISAMDDLKSLEPALMTSSERAALRTALVEQLNLQPAAPLVVTTRRRPWWQPVLGIASAAALLVAIIAVPSLLSGSDDSSADIMAIAPVTTTTFATTELDADRQSSASEGDAAVTTSTILVPQVAEQEVPEFFAASPSQGETTESISTYESDEAVASGAEDETDDTIPDSTTMPLEFVATADAVAINTEAVDACLALLIDDLPEGEHTPLAATIDDGVVVVHFGTETVNGVVYTVSIDLESCVVTPLSP